MTRPGPDVWMADPSRDGVIPGAHPNDPETRAYRAQLLFFRREPEARRDPEAGDESVVWIDDGLLVVRDGRILQSGDYGTLAPGLPANAVVVDWRGHLLTPGFIDTHVHYPQTDMIASPAPGVLPWLQRYTFPVERRFEEAAYAREVARFFLDELLRCGTTTAMVYCTVHAGSVEAFFAESEQRNLRMIAGKVMMDRHCPDYLRDTPESGVRETEAIIQRWHGRGRQLVAITPRFAPTSSPAQLAGCQALAQAHPGVFIQTHVAESPDEVNWAMSLFPACRSYLDIYERHGLLRPRAVYGHCIWLDDEDRRRMQATGAVAAHCPTSNLFLGSGLFDMAATRQAGVAVTLGTDVGGGTSFSMLRTMHEAHKVARLRGQYLSAEQMFWYATQGAAAALGLEGRIGTLAPGAEADFIVLDPHATPLMARRMDRAQSLEERLFALAMLGDDRAVAATYVAGREAYHRPSSRTRP